MPSEYLQEVANDYEKLLEDNEDCNVIIYVGENENVKELHAHSCILRIRSQYFRAALSKEWSEKKDEKFVFRKPNISPQLFEVILRFIYCGRIDLEKLQGPDILKLLIAVDGLGIQTLVIHTQEYLIEHQFEYLQQNPIVILETIYQHETFMDLFNLSLKKICGEPEILFSSDEFMSLKPSLLELLLKRDDLLLDEIVIWDNLIKWCFAQHSNISQDPTQWNNEEFTLMERTISKFIPLVRFNYISPESFATKVYPFKVIMPKSLVNNMILFYMAQNKQLNEDKGPPRQSKCKIDSVIINQKHIEIFANWIYRKVKVSEYIPYNFHLLYRASRDVGGYNPLSWDTSNTWKSTYDSFIFSFTNRDDLQSANFGYSNGVNSIGCYGINGPVFGEGSDLAFYGGTWFSHINNNNCYPKIDIQTGGFKADDYEIFQVIKK
ncbi:hypothetical protein GLOIN_2v1769270 [Rhizophagus irregularis DAOM 181602=DAOM 197198]|nr:hypothetical protein GLOIN_2v1769270 [Rhizophagus irregularis DAOM 181602=DAOM 197198]